MIIKMKIRNDLKKNIVKLVKLDFVLPFNKLTRKSTKLRFLSRK